MLDIKFDCDIIVATMTVHVDKSKSGKYVRYLLRSSFRVDGKVKHRTVANISHCSPEEIDAIKLALQHKGDLTPLVSLREDVIGAAVAGTGGSDPAPGTPAPWRPCSHQKEAAVKTQRALILQPDIAVRSTALCWNIRYIYRGFDP